MLDGASKDAQNPSFTLSFSFSFFEIFLWHSLAGHSEKKKFAIKEIGRDFTETSAVDGKDKKIKIDTCC